MSIFKSNILQNLPILTVKKSVSIPHIALALLLIFVVGLGAIPGYLSGKWSWTDVPQITHIEQLVKLRETELKIAGWKTLQQQEVLISGNQWSLQIINQEPSTQAALLLLPQDYYKNKPAVEWTDLQLLGHWQTSHNQNLKFTSQNSDGKLSQVNARLFRSSMPPVWKSLRNRNTGKKENQTFIVVEWYAWPGGGSFSAGDWFWQDQWAQLHQGRLPWVAVCLQIPIDPFSDLKDSEPLAKSLAQQVQSSLETQIFTKLGFSSS
jgi:cyanoexosortase B-associated protein